MVRVATRKQQKARDRRRRGHARGVKDRDRPRVEPVVETPAPEPAPDENPVSEEAAETAKPQTPAPWLLRLIRTIENISLGAQVLGAFIWVVGAFLHYGHIGALIGAAVCLVGFCLFWVAMVASYKMRLMFRRDPWFTVALFCMLLSLCAGLAVGAWIHWGVGLIVGVTLLVGGFWIGVVTAKGR